MEPRRDAFAETNLCVKCGLCLPHCPTYRITQDENESPRGRLALIQGWADDRLDATPRLIEHLDNCLLCRNCEAVCPAEVPYSRLMDRFRGEVRSARRPLRVRLVMRLIRHLLGQPRQIHWVRRIIESGYKSSVTRLLQSVSGDLAALLSGLPDTLPAPLGAAFYPAQGEERCRVALFRGCTGNLADADTVAAAVRLLTRLGVAVVIPESQTCCGALDLHGGGLARARRLMAQNLEAFQDAVPVAIVTLASGCGAVLKEYGAHPSETATHGFTRKVVDISEFVSGWLESCEVSFQPLPATVALHTPCTLANVQRAAAHPVELLRRIPELNLRVLPQTGSCCGAAGSYLIEHPDMARTLREAVLTQVESIAPDYVLTSNVGCAMHLRAGARALGGGKISVLHPITLIEAQLRTHAAAPCREA